MGCGCRGRRNKVTERAEMARPLKTKRKAEATATATATRISSLVSRVSTMDPLDTVEVHKDRGEETERGPATKK